MKRKWLMFWSELLIPSVALVAGATPSHAVCLQDCPVAPSDQLAGNSLMITQANGLANYTVNGISSLQPELSLFPSFASLSTPVLESNSSLPSSTPISQEMTSAPIDLFPQGQTTHPDRLLTISPIVPSPATSPRPLSLAQQAATRIQVSRIEVTGNTVISNTEIAEKTNPAIGKQLTIEELRNLADSITQLYLDKGYITSRAILGDQTVRDGVVQIKVVEGGLQKIEVEGAQRVDPNYIRNRIELAGISPVKQDRLEDQLRLLRADPLFENVEASLRAGDQLGQSILTVRVAEANPFVAAASFDNFSPASVGSERFGVSLAYRNLTGVGDQLSGSYNITTTAGSQLWDFSYRIPVNPMNGTVQVRIAPSTYRITDPTFVSFGIRGNSELYEVVYRQPLARSPREEFALSLGFTYQRGQSFIFNNIPTPFGIGPDVDGVSTTSVLKFGQDYVSRDVQGAWALRSQFSLGLGILGATINPTASNPFAKPDGRFFSWLFQAQRVQLLSPDQILILQADLQLALDPLLPSQQFVVGGGQSVRGFRQSTRSGDNGFRFSAENRIAIQRDEAGAPVLQLAPFIDLGAVWNNSANPNTLPNQTFLAAAGLGIIWEPLPKLVLRLDYGLPLINLTDRGNNLQDSSFYFSVNYQL